MQLNADTIIPTRPQNLDEDIWLYQNFEAIRYALAHGHWPRRAQAEFYPGGVKFDVAHMMAGEFSIYGAPTTVRHFVFSFWIARNAGNTVVPFSVIESAGNHRVRFTVSDTLQIEWWNDAGVKVVDVTSATGIHASNLTHVCGFIDTDSGVADIYIDGTAVAVTKTTLTTAADLFIGHGRWGMNGNALALTGLDQFSLAEFFLDLDPFVDDTSTIAAKFSDGSKPIDLGFLGYLPYETLPTFYCTGLGAGFQNVGLGGKMFFNAIANLPSTFLGV